MPVIIKLAIREGWKQKDNERFGDCLEARFIDPSNNKIMFRYAPLLSDKEIWTKLFTLLERYDKLHKEIYTLVSTDIEGQGFGSMANCHLPTEEK